MMKFLVIVAILAIGEVVFFGLVIMACEFIDRHAEPAELSWDEIMGQICDEQAGIRTTSRDHDQPDGNSWRHSGPYSG